MGVFKILLFILYHNDYYYFISPSLGSSPFSSGTFIRQQTPKSRLWSGALLHFIMRIVLGTPLRPGFSPSFFLSTLITLITLLMFLHHLSHGHDGRVYHFCGITLAYY
jgi:hypothetical protein